MIALTFIVLGSLFLSWVFVGWVRWMALARGWVAAPRKDRWHEKPTALHGGVGMVLSFVVGTAALYFVGLQFPQYLGGQNGINGFPAPSVMLVLVAAGLMMALTGWVDDCRNLKPGLEAAAGVGRGDVGDHDGWTF
jgi:UDP-GlcNAc:undecaprenyl-phosphate/decaprenyl-phosphate GlcNAc-1-phosphate transferase